MESLGKLFAAEPVQLGTLLSICSGIVLAAVGFVRSRVEDRKRYTLGVLMGYSQSTELLRSLHVVREYAANQPEGECKVDEAIAGHLAVILPHFQSIALAAERGLLDRDIILSARYASMKAIWENYAPYVRRKRQQLNRPLLFVELEEFLRTNEVRYEAYRKRFADRYSGSVSPASQS